MSAESVTMLTVHILIDGKDILPDVFRNEEIAKGVLVSGTTFLVTYSSGILAEEIGSAIEKIDECLGKPVVIMHDEVAAIQLPQVIKHAHCTMGVESVVFNTRVDGMRYDSNPSVHSEYHSYEGSPAVLGTSGTSFPNKNPRYTRFFSYIKGKGHCHI